MQIGFNLPVSGPMAAPEVIANIAQLGESLGFDYLTLTDHIADLPEAIGRQFEISLRERAETQAS